MNKKEAYKRLKESIKNCRYIPKSLKLHFFRDMKFLEGISREQQGLEIGPSHHPIVSKKDGYCVETVDWLDMEGLKEHYGNDGVDLDAIEPVDYVWKGGSYYELIQKDAYYDYIIASHMIEHSTDFIGFLHDCSRLLKKEGILRLAVPDKRYCFDHYRFTTGLAEVLNNAYAPDNIQTAGNVAEYYINAVSRKGRISWNKPALPFFDFFMKHRNSDYKFVHDKDIAVDGMRRARAGEYIDIHHYVFTPASFELLVYDLRVLEMIDMKIVHMWNTRKNEFIVTLRKTDERPGQDCRYRQRLLRKRDNQNRV